MVLPVTVSDPDRRIGFALAVDCSVRPGMQPRSGWRDGGSAGESPAIELEGARCLAIYVWCGTSHIMAHPANSSERALENNLGRWCLEEYADEIDSAIWRILSERRASARTRC